MNSNYGSRDSSYHTQYTHYTLIHFAAHKQCGMSRLNTNCDVDFLLNQVEIKWQKKIMGTYRLARGAKAVLVTYTKSIIPPRPVLMFTLNQIPLDYTEAQDNGQISLVAWSVRSDVYIWHSAAGGASNGKCFFTLEELKGNASLFAAGIIATRRVH